jgi:hypothetical protein
MLDPRERQLLLEALRPPPGHCFDRAVGTTFSLEPTALLAVPLALAAFDANSEEHAPHDDSLALLEAVRRNASHLSLFCQAGRIAVPAKYRSLLTYLERSVVEVTPPRAQFVFHPKVWLVRYSGATDTVTYRLLCLTRNLTFDRSWDTVLTLEGPLTKRTNAFPVNHPLGDFTAALPQLAVREVPQRVRRDVELIAAEVRRVAFEPPTDFDSYGFVALGLDTRKSWSFPGGNSKGLVVSPFLTAETLQHLPDCPGGLTLVSRLEALSELSAPVLARFAACYALSEMAEPEPSDDETTPADTLSLDADQTAAVAAPLSGLHAKLFVFDQGRKARLWSGSANATWRAFHGNVEFLVELRGSRARCGVDKLLGEAGKGGLADLLEEFQPLDAPPPDEAAAKLARLLDEVRTAVAARPLRLSVTPGVTGPAGWHVRLVCPEKTPLELEPEVTVAAWPISLSAERATPCQWSGDFVADFGELSLEALTPFVAFAVHVQTPETSDQIVFVVNLPIDGEPAGREAQVLRQMLRHPGDLIALLLLLLAEDELAILDALSGSTEAGPASAWQAFGGRGLLEALVRTLARDPAKLRAVKRLIDELRQMQPAGEAAVATGESGTGDDLESISLIPPGFEQIWQPIWQTACELGVGDPGSDGHD